MKELLKKISPLYRLYLLYLKKKRELYNTLTIPDYKLKRKIILDLARQYRCNEVFIETGTFMGDTVDYLKDIFKHVISIELNENLAKKAAVRFRNNPNVQIVQGDSVEKLSLILSSIDSSVVFWLDGHYSSAFQAGKEFIVTGKGTKDTPVMEELRQIENHTEKQHLILIDDARLFNGTNDYPTLIEIKLFVKNRLPGYKCYVKNDIIRILPKSRQ